MARSRGPWRVDHWRPTPADTSLTAPEVFLRRQWAWIGPALVAAAALYQWQVRDSLAEWDWLLVSGAALFALLFPMSLALPDRAADCLDRLAGGGTLMDGESPVPDAAGLTRVLHGQARAWALLVAPIACALMLGVWIVSGGITVPNAPLVVLEVLGAGLAGLYLGRAIGYGRMGRSLAGQGIVVKARPGHPDGVAGLRSVGEQFLFNATIFAAIAGYLGIWPLTDFFETNYAHWVGPYRVLLATVVAFSFLAFILPLRWFHQRMREQKRQFVAEADRAAAEALSIREASRSTDDEQSRRALEAKVEHLTHWYHEVQAMPTWPVDRRIRKRFTSNQVLVMLPLVLKALSLDDTWTAFWTRLGQALLGEDT